MKKSARLAGHIGTIYPSDMSDSECMILGLLHLEDLSSYDVKIALEKLASHYFSPSLGSIVPSLHRLQAEGSARVRTASVGQRKKKVYSLTAKGRARFGKWMRAPTDIERDEDALLVKIFFFGLVEEAERRAIVSACCDDLLKRERHLKKLGRESEKKAATLELPSQLREVPPFQIATIEFGVAHYRFLRRWLERRFLS